MRGASRVRPTVRRSSCSRSTTSRPMVREAGMAALEGSATSRNEVLSQLEEVQSGLVSQARLRRALQDLDANRAELEAQEHELNDLRWELEAERDRYAELFDF